MAYYVYKFTDAEERVLYVGITNNLNGRIRSQHFTRNGHLPADCYQRTALVLYSQCASETDAKIKERYLINKLTPQFNSKMNKGDAIPWAIEDFDWKYIGFDNERMSVGSANLGGHVSRRKAARDQSLRDELGVVERILDLSSAVRTGPSSDLLWLDWDQAEKAGLEYALLDELGISYVRGIMSGARLLSGSYRLNQCDKGEPIGRLTEFHRRGRREKPYDEVIQEGPIWLILSRRIDPSKLPVRAYTHNEKLALRIEEVICTFEHSISTTDGWTIAVDDDGDAWIGICNTIESSLNYGSLASLMPAYPAVSYYEKGRSQWGNGVLDLPDYVDAFARYQHQLGAYGIHVYATEEVRRFKARANKMIQKLTSAPAHSSSLC